MARAGASRNQAVDVLTFKPDLTAGPAVNVHFYNLSPIKHVAGLRRADPLFSVSLSLLFLNSVPFKTLSRVPPSCFLSFLLFALGAPRRLSSSLARLSFYPAASEFPWKAQLHFLVLFLLGTKSAQGAHEERSRGRVRARLGSARLGCSRVRVRLVNRARLL